jgi:transcriptional regulator with XRE-family HTH domain
MSQAKISRIETGKVLPTVIDVEQVIKALDVPAGVAADLLDLAREANVDYASWRAYARTGLWRKQVEIKALAESAKIIRQFLPAVPTGLLQTEAVARSTLLPTVGSDPSMDVEKAVKARLVSQEALDDRSRRFVFLMTEQAVRWRLAGPRAMAEQAEHMAEVARQENVEIAIIPRTAKVPEVPLNVFVVYDERLVTAELFSGEVVLRDPRDVVYHLELFDFFLSHALRGDDAVSFLRALAEEFMRELD